MDLCSSSIVKRDADCGRATKTHTVSLAQIHLALLLTQFCWGSAAVVNKLGLSGPGMGMNPLVFALIRDVAAAPLLLLLIMASRGKLCSWSGWSPAPSLVDSEHSSMGGAGSLMLRLLPGVFIFIDQLCSLTGVKLTSATCASAWQPSQVIFTVLISVCIGTEELTLRKAVGVALTVSGGVFLVLLGGGATEASGGHPRLGQLLFFVNCLASSLEVILWRSLLRKSRSPLCHLTVMAESYLAAACLMVSACVATSQFPAAVDFLCPECHGDAWHVPPAALWAVSYSVIFQTLVGYCAQAWALKYAESSLAALYATMQPVMATAFICALLLARPSLSEAVVWPGREMAGALLIILGLLVTIPGPSAPGKHGDAWVGGLFGQTRSGEAYGEDEEATLLGNAACQ